MNNVCFWCGKPDHYPKDYPQGVRRLPTNGRVYVMIELDIEATPTVIEGTLSISDLFAHTLISSGANDSFVYVDFAKKFLN